jgi:hypothetical protein
MSEEAKVGLESLFERFSRITDTAALLQIVQHCRHKDWHRIAFALGMLLREELSDSWQLDYELSICAYYANRKDFGLQTCNRLLLQHDVPDHAFNSTLTNMHFYMPVLAAASHTELTKPQMPELPEHWCLLNPGICSVQDVVHINVRMVNSGGDWFRLNDGRPVTSDTPIRTVNCRMSWPDQQWRDWDCKHSVRSFGGPVIGLEDLRLFGFRDRVWFMATTREFSPDFRNGMFLGTDDFGVAVSSPFDRDCEKNWLPFEHEGKLLCIYLCDPLVVLELDPQTGRTKVLVQHQHAGLHMQTFRGSAPPIALGDDYYFIVHEVAEARRYSHRIVRMTQNFEITHVSLPFHMQQRHKVEYVAGWTRVGDSVLITWGDGDTHAMLSQVPVRTIQEMCADGSPAGISAPTPTS